MAEKTELYKKIDDLVRNHSHGEPYITNVVDRIYDLVTRGLPPEAINSRTDYQKGYATGYQTAKRKSAPKPHQETSK